MVSGDPNTIFSAVFVMEYIVAIVFSEKVLRY